MFRLEAKGEALTKEIQRIVADIQKEFDKNPVSIYVGFNRSVLDNSIANVLKYIQEKFNNNTVKIKATIDIDNSKSNTTSTNTYDWSNDNSLGKKVGGGFSAGKLTGQDDRTLGQKVTDWIEDNIISPVFGKAEGGLVPNVGTLFYAGEAGAEVVTNLGHSTGVMNVSQMQEAVANGNSEVVNAVYAMANLITGAINSKNFDVYMDASKVGRSVTKYQNNQARRGTEGAY